MNKKYVLMLALFSQPIVIATRWEELLALKMAEPYCDKKWMQFDQFLKGCFEDKECSLNWQPLQHRVTVQVNPVSSEKHKFFTFDNVSDSDVPIILESLGDFFRKNVRQKSAEQEADDEWFKWTH